jgi:2-succinyl-5-enolpyruvyl-6-hydroxy-3-cyclohexene-1-carboxylate synthase
MAATLNRRLLLESKKLRETARDQRAIETVICAIEEALSTGSAGEQPAAIQKESSETEGWLVVGAFNLVRRANRWGGRIAGPHTSYAARGFNGTDTILSSSRRNCSIRFFRR